MGNTRNLGDLLNTDSTIATADVADGGITTAKLADDAVTGAKIENNPTIAGNLTVSGGFIPSATTAGKNMIINGAMKIHQRADTLTNTPKAVDRFQLVKNNLDTANFSERHYVAGEAEVREFGGDSLEIKCTTADTSIGSAELIHIRHQMEAQFLRRLAWGTANAKTTTLSFSVYSNVTGTYAVVFQTVDGTGRNISATYTISSANTWERKTITIVGDTGATMNNDNGLGLEISWILSAGSNYTSSNPNGAWANKSDARFAYGHNVNIASAVNNVFYLTGVQWEEGSVATPFEQENKDLTLRKCQRYYYKGKGENNAMGKLMAPAGNLNDFSGYCYFPVEMQRSPTLTITAPQLGLGDDMGGISVSTADTMGVHFIRTVNDSNAGRAGLEVRGEADAELQ